MINISFNLWANKRKTRTKKIKRKLKIEIVNVSDKKKIKRKGIKREAIPALQAVLIHLMTLPVHPEKRTGKNKAK